MLQPKNAFKNINNDFLHLLMYKMQSKRTKERVHSATIQRCLHGRATPLGRPLIGPFILQWDNEPKHTAKVVKNNLQHVMASIPKTIRAKNEF